VLSVAGLLATVVACVVYLMAVVLDTPVTHRPDAVTVRLARTGGLFEGSPATYRGVRVGTVRRISLDERGVVARVVLRDGVRVPRDSRARVRSLSPVGEQFLDFAPAGEGGPYLEDGDEVAADAVDLPVQLATAAGSLERLLGQVDQRDLRVVLRELSAATHGTGDDLDRLLTSTHQLTTAFDESWPAAERLLRNGETVGELVASQNAELTAFSRDARTLAAWLRGFDPEFRRILATAPRGFDQVHRFMDTVGPVLPPFLDELVAVGDLLWEREPHLRALAPALGFGAGRFASAFRDGWLDVDLYLEGQKQCQYPGPRRDPMSGRREPTMLDGHCRVSDQVWRGAENAPPPVRR